MSYEVDGTNIKMHQFPQFISENDFLAASFLNNFDKKSIMSCRVLLCTPHYAVLTVVPF